MALAAFSAGVGGLTFINAGEGARPEDPNASGGHARRAQLMQPFVIDMNATVEELLRIHHQLLDEAPHQPRRRKDDGS